MLCDICLVYVVFTPFKELINHFLSVFIQDVFEINKIDVRKEKKTQHFEKSIIEITVKTTNFFFLHPSFVTVVVVSE